MAASYALEHEWGKNDVRVSKVTKNGATETFNEYTVNMILTSPETISTFTVGDNSYVVPTDTMKNTVYVVANDNEFDSPERFATLIANHFLETYSHVTSATVTVEQHVWNRMEFGGKEHDFAFVKSHDERRIGKIVLTRRSCNLSGGLRNLRVLKTHGSGFAGFPVDRYTTLNPVKDRLLTTSVSASWNYTGRGGDYNAAYENVRETCLSVFANEYSNSVQNSLYVMGERILSENESVLDVTIQLPNIHNLPMDTSKWGCENTGNVYHPTSEPSGHIKATMKRERARL